MEWCTILLIISTIAFIGMFGWALGYDIYSTIKYQNHIRDKWGKY